ncbi:hypothetical protein [Ligilactobacillus salivarius]|uniref:hypothetical protein n=1 Tax=Ligilactobacillus salivarius TaxID=1624 RepID=UPI003A810252
MDLTKEALDYLTERGIRPEERKLKINGQEYIIDKNGEPVLVEPVIYKAKEPIRLNTLSGLVDYIKSNIDGFDDLILHVVDEKLVELKGKLQPNGDRELLAVATAIVPEFDFDSYMDIESFNIALQSLGIGITSVYTLSSDLKRGVINPKIKIYSVRGI